MSKQENRVALITGAAGGVGAAAARELVNSGWRLVLTDLHSEHLAEVAQDFEDGVAVSMRLDITDPSSCDAAAACALENFGRLDALVNSAGISQPANSFTQPAADWAKMIEVQLSGAYFIAQSCGRVMAENNGGSIVFIGSTNAEAAFPRRAAYCSAKAGVAMLTKVLAIEWAEQNIRVNSIGPAYVETPMTLRNIDSGNISREAVEKRIPLGRLAKPEDVSNAVSFLLSERSSFITGQTLYVDGGWLAYGYF